jgi:regulator of sirC expression with transglutaminase-like and TPR domain
MIIKTADREIILPHGEHLIRWLDRCERNHELAKKIEAIINSEPEDHEEIRRIAWLEQRLEDPIPPTGDDGKVPS